MNAIEQRTCQHCAQNQSAPSPGRWDRTGIVWEVRPNRRYIIQMHGSQRLVLRNRVHLQKVTPLYSPPTGLWPRLMPGVPQWRHHRPHADRAHPQCWTECLFQEATSRAPSTQHLHALVKCLRMELTGLPSPCLTLTLSIQEPWNDNSKETGNYPMLWVDDPSVPTGRPNGTRTMSCDCISLNAQDWIAAAMFEDDTKLCRRTDTPNGPVELQEDLDCTFYWSYTWLMKFQPTKCKVLYLGQRQEHEIRNLYLYSSVTCRVMSVFY